METSIPLLLTGSLNYIEDDCACPDNAFSLYQATPTTIENDCACPDNAFSLQSTTPAANRFTRTPTVHTQPLPAGFHLAHSPFAPAGPSILNQPAFERWHSFDVARPLHHEIDRQLLEQRLLQPAGETYQPFSQRAETLTAWLHVTNACNLDCPYCYVRKSSARMSLETGTNAIQSLVQTARTNGFRRLKLKYAGGEATLHFKLIRELHALAGRFAAENDLQLAEVILSNGYRLRPEDADWLLGNRVKLMISLDGIGEMHDQLRPLKGGGPTFARVAHTIDNVLLPRGLRPDITITVTRLNAVGADEAVQWALERDLPISLNFFRQNPLTTSPQALALEESAIIDGMLAAYDVFANVLPERPFFNGLLDRVQGEAHTHTCGVQHSYLIVTHQGQLAQCQMHQEQAVAAPAGSDWLPIVATGSIQNIAVDEKEGCRDCEFRYRCTGGCPVETYRATGRWDIKSPHCHIYKTLLPRALQLEGMRLLKVHGFLS